MCTRTKAASNNPLDNLAHCSYESGILEKPDVPAPKSVWTRTVGMFLESCFSSPYHFRCSVG